MPGPSSKKNLLLRNPDFRRVWIGQVLSQAGSRAYFINLLWWMVSRPGAGESASLWSGALLVFIGLPSLLLLKFIGRALSTRPSKTILVTAELAGALFVSLVFLLAVRDELTPTIVIVLSTLVAVCQAFVDPALAKSVRELVDTEDMEYAVGFESSTQAIAFFSGAALGAVSAGTIGFANTIALNIASYVISAWLTSRARFRTHLDDQVDAGEPITPTQIRNLNHEVMTLLRSFAASNFFMFPIFLILPLVIQSSGGSIVGLGGLEACFWIGLLIGAFAAPHVEWTKSYLTLCATAYAVFGAALASLSFILHPLWMALVLGLGGFSAGFVNVKVNGFFQREVPEPQRGTFFATLQAYVGGSQPLSYLAFTAMFLVLAPKFGFLVAGLGLVAIGSYCFSRKS